MSDIIRARFTALWTPEPNTGCFLWTGEVGAKGYGRFYIKGKPHRASRIAWTLAGRDLPPGLFVCHKCDQPSCVNPEHLFLGSHKENMADMCRKERQARGSRGGQAKLTEDQIRWIFEQRKLLRTQRQIGDALGVSDVQVGRILNGRLWRHFKA